MISGEKGGRGESAVPGHGYQTIDTAETNTDGPQPCALNNPLTHQDIARLKTQHGARAARHAPVQLVLWMRLQTRIAYGEAERLEERSDGHRVALLLLHAYTESLDAT